MTTRVLIALLALAFWNSAPAAEKESATKGPSVSERKSADPSVGRGAGREIFAAAYDAADKGDLNLAVALLKKGLAVEPTNYRARFRLAEYLTMTGDDVEATKELERVIAQAPKNSAESAKASIKLEQTAAAQPTVFSEAYQAIDEGNVAFGVELLKKGLEQDPKNYGARLSYADWMFKATEYLEAQNQYKQVVKTAPKNSVESARASLQLEALAKMDLRSIPQPVLTIGDEWVLRQRNIKFPEYDAVRKATVVKADLPRGYDVQDQKVEGFGIESKKYRMDANLNMHVTDIFAGVPGAVAKGEATVLEFPLFVGKKWESRYSFAQGETTTQNWMQCETLAFEQLRVLDEDSQVAHVQCRMLITTPPATKPTLYTSHYWYSPKHQCIARMTSDSQTMELVSRSRH